MAALWEFLGTVNGVIWHPMVLYVVLGVGVLFTLWSGFSQFKALTHGTKVVRGAYDDKDDPGAINHFQALSAALSATVGLGNIAGVGVAVALGGPGAVFYMWVVGLFGMAIKTTEVCLSMLYRNTDDPNNPHGGPMFVAAKGLKEKGFAGLGKFVGGIFVVTLLISTITGGNMFQAWSVGEITENYFHVPSIVAGIVLAIAVALVIIGGIKRIGAVAGRVVPVMCGLYIAAALVVLVLNAGAIPEMLVTIVREAFSPSEAEGAFLGGTVGYALLWGMKRALFSSEAGQGSSPIAHSAAKTDEPVREAVVAGLEPFIDTIVVCTITALVIMTTGAFNRSAEITLGETARVAVGFSHEDEGQKFWTLRSETLVGDEWVASETPVDADGDGEQDLDTNGNAVWDLGPALDFKRTNEAVRVSGPLQGGEDVFIVVKASHNDDTGLDLHRMAGRIVVDGEEARRRIEWFPFASDTEPIIQGQDIWVDYPGPSLTGHAFDRAVPGLGKYLVTLAAWLFALSTMISWSYYGEQGIVFLFGDKAVLPYKFVYCVAIIVAASGIIRTDAQLDSLTALGTGVMLWSNIPIMLLFGATAMGAYHSYMKRLKAGEFDSHEHKPASVTDVVEGKDVE